METYLRAFVNFERNNLARLLLMAEFAYNIAKNVSTGHMSFELNYSYHPGDSYKIYEKYRLIKTCIQASYVI